ncbi:hypothetical protein HZS_763 [Henneguya salminicola]|nr:hypothetical protein HZS_763 [Henneguya salminicola]
MYLLILKTSSVLSGEFPPALIKQMFERAVSTFIDIFSENFIVHLFEKPLKNVSKVMSMWSSFIVSLKKNRGENRHALL